MGQWVYTGTVHLNTRLLWHLFFSSDVSVCFNFFIILLLVPLWQSSWRVGHVAVCFHSLLPQLTLHYTWSVQGRWKGRKGANCKEFFWGRLRLIHLLGVHLLTDFAIGKLAMKNGCFWASYSGWQLLTVQPFNSIITFHSLWGAVSATTQLYFSFLVGLICFLIHKQLILKRWWGDTACFSSGDEGSLCVQRQLWSSEW